MKRFWQNIQSTLFRYDPIWTTNLIVLAAAVFTNQFGQGLLGSVRTNFFVDTLGLTGGQVLWLEGIREIPGLALMFIAALTMRLPLSKRASAALLITGLGYGLFATIHSYSALLVIAVGASLGLHMWMPLHRALGMSLSPKDKTGQVMGNLSSVAAMASLMGMGAITLVSRLLAGTSVSLRVYYIVGGAFIVSAALLLLKLPSHIGATETEPPRILLKRRYWLYYVLTFFEGSRKQVLHTFGTLVLVETFKFEVWQVGSLMLISSIVNLIGSPYMGRLIDRFGERTMVSLSYVCLVLCCVGFGFIHTAWILVLLLVVIKLMITASIGLSTYVYRTAPPEELTPTLSAGISINHVTSVAMPLIAGAVLPLIGYEGIFLGTAVLIALSVPFALAMKGREAVDTTAPATVAAAEG